MYVYKNVKFYIIVYTNIKLLNVCVSEFKSS